MGCLLLLAYCMPFSSIYRDYFVVAAKSMQEYSRKHFKWLEVLKLGAKYLFSYHPHSDTQFSFLSLSLLAHVYVCICHVGRKQQPMEKG